MKEPGHRETIARSGRRVAIMSNKITDEQVTKVERFAKSLACGKMTLLCDADEAGDNGAKKPLWLLSGDSMCGLAGAKRCTADNSRGGSRNR